MIKKLLLLFIILTNNIYCQDDFQKAFEKTLVVENYSNTIDYLYFSIETEPVFFGNELVDVFYSIKYDEIGTNFPVMWVNKYDGHLINVPDKSASTQLKGPFGGLREIKYQFLFELIDYDKSPYKKAVKILIFSSNPSRDAEYFNSYYTSPYVVTATYYDYSIGNTLLDIYSNLSTLYTAYNISKSSNPTTLIVTSVIENIILISVKNYMNNQPIYIEIKNMNTGEIEKIVHNNLNDFIYQFPGDSRRIIIKFSQY